jgi:hypothetical protein
MAMRDPGTPGRNPFFDHGPDAELGDLPSEPAEPVSEPTASEPDFELPFDPAAWGGSAGGGGADPLGTLAALVDALQGAQPEATEHLIAAAHELVLAVKTVVDATEAVLAASRASAAATASHDARGDAAGESVYDPFASPDEPPAPPDPPRPSASPASGVRRIDLA